MPKAYYQVKVKDNEKIVEGYLFVYDSIDKIIHKVGDPLNIVNPYTKFPEKCQVCEVCEADDPRTGSKGTMVKFTGSDQT